MRCVSNSSEFKVFTPTWPTGKLLPNEKELLMKKVSDVMFSKANVQD